MGIIQRQSIQASVITYAGTLLGYINLSYLFPVFLSAEQVGLTRMLLYVGVLFSQFALLGSSYSILRFFPYFNHKENKHYGILTYSILVSMAGFLLFGLLLFVFRGPVGDFFRQKSALFVDNYFYIYPIAFFMMAFEVMFFYARSLFKMVVPILVKEVILRLLQTLALLLYVFHIVNFQGFLVAFCGTYLVHYLVILLYLSFLKQLFWLAPVRINEVIKRSEVNRYSLFVYATSIASIYTSYIDSIMLGAMGGLTDIAIYSIAISVGTLVVIPSRAMNQVAIPVIAEAWKNNDMKKLQQLYKQTAINQFIVGAFILLMLWINIDLFLGFLPPLYSAAKWPMLIIGFARLFDMATGINAEIILYSKHVKFNLATNLMLIVVSTLVTYFLIPVYGITGAAISVPVAYVFYNGIRIIFLYTVYRMQPFSANNLKVLLIFFVLFFATFFIPREINIWVRSIGFSIIAAAAFIITNLSLRTSDEIDALYKKLKSGIFRDTIR